MKVLHILNELLPSGAEVMLKVAGPYWNNAGFKSHVLSTGDRPGIYSNILQNAGYNLHHIPFKKSPFFFKKIYKIIKKNKFDVVHIHTERANFYYAFTARSAGTKKIIRTIHSVFKFTGHVRIQRKIQRKILKNIGVRSISISPSVKKNELEQFKNSTNLILNWYSDRFQPLKDIQSRSIIRNHLGISDSTFVIVSVGNCSKIKNHKNLLRALKLFKCEQKFIYYHIGNEENNCNERNLAHELGIYSCVKFLGFLEDPLQYLQVADAYVLPSLYEGFGMAAIEALGAGVPTVLADVPGLRDIRYFSNAPIWVSTTSESIHKGLVKLAAMSPEKRMEIGLRAHASVKKHFGVKRAVEAYKFLYVVDDKSVQH